MGNFSVGGLASGLDTSSIISQLMQVERQPRTRFEWRKDLWSARKNVWNDLSTRLSALRQAADKLASPLTWSSTAGPTTVTTSNAVKVGAAAVGPAPEVGEYTIKVSKLAGTSTWESSATPGTVLQNQNLTFQSGGFTGAVAITAGDDVNTVSNKINADPDVSALVTASVVGGKLVLESKTSGAAGDMLITSNRNNANNYLASAGVSETINGQDAEFTVNGLNFTRTSNSITDVIGDVQIDLLGVDTAGTTITVDDGTLGDGGIKQAILDFVDKYNAAIDFINSKSGEAKVVNPKTKDEFLKGPVASDFGFRSVANDLRRWASDIVAGVGGSFDSLDDIGISTGAASAGFDPNKVTGRLVVDQAKLDAALANDMASVQELFTKAGGGFASEGIGKRIGGLAKQMIQGGRVDAAIDGASAQIQQLQDTLDRFDERLSRKQAYYDRMFASLESMLGQLQQQGNWLSGQLSSLPTSGGTLFG